MRRRAVAVVMVAIGVALIGLTLGANLFGRTKAHEGLTDDFRPLMDKTVLSRLRADVDGFQAAFTEFDKKGVPMLAGVQKTSPDEVRASIAKNYPTAGVVLAELPAALTEYTGLINTFEAQRDNFRSADAIPTKSVPSTVTPWVMLAFGVLAIGVGILMLRPGIVAPVVMVAMGLALLLGPLALSFPRKAVDADAVNAAFKPAITKELVAEAKQVFGSLDAMSSEMDSMIADIGKSMGLDPAQTKALMGAVLPKFTAMMADLPAKTGGFKELIGTLDGNIDNYYLLRNMAFQPFVWVFLLMGTAMTLAGAFVFKVERQLARAARLAGAAMPGMPVAPTATPPAANQ